jgi:acetylglutamate kinase
MNQVVLIKYGGNAMSNEFLKKQVLTNIAKLKEKNIDVVIVHGGGPFIKQALADANVQSEFIDGQRQTTPEAFTHVEMTLKGKVNSALVSLLNTTGQNAVGLSGRDGKLVIAKKRQHKTLIEGQLQEVDMGRVGDVDRVNTKLIYTLLENDFIPVISCIAADEDGIGYNVNGDMFAGHVAGALNADQYIVLTDVDGLMEDKDDPKTIIRSANLLEVENFIEQGIIQGGMIPKMESCEVALLKGAKAARIINGTMPEQLLELIENDSIGTKIIK